MEEMSDKELIKISIEEFSRLQSYMQASEKNTASYNLMMIRYIELKVFLNSAGVNLTKLDVLQE